jgi:hypothetical protein
MITHCPHGKGCTTTCQYPYLNTKEGILPCDEVARRKSAGLILGRPIPVIYRDHGRGHHTLSETKTRDGGVATNIRK